tara:strand:+ start:873 stop:1094 length:222 start_codon:yes stop_codon:yes gene_type:complete
LNLSIAQKFLIFRDTMLSRLTSHSRLNELMQIDIKNLEHKLDMLDSKVDVLENNIREVGQAVIEGQASNEEEF